MGCHATQCPGRCALPGLLGLFHLPLSAKRLERAAPPNSMLDRTGGPSNDRLPNGEFIIRPEQREPMTQVDGNTPRGHFRIYTYRRIQLERSRIFSTFFDERTKKFPVVGMNRAFYFKWEPDNPKFTQHYVFNEVQNFLHFFYSAVGIYFHSLKL